MDQLSRTVNTQSIRSGAKQTHVGRIDKKRSHSDQIGQQQSHGDPRIDSPEISVVYPSVTHDLPRFKEPTQMDEAKTQSKQEETGQKCTCKNEGKTNWLTAIKQNGTHFLLMALVLLVMGYAFGKQR